jgi:aspartate/methionine/tyrosine aminotransferase
MEPVAVSDPETFAFGNFLARWGGLAHFDLSGSESAELTLTDLLSMAQEDDLRRWQNLSLGYGDPRGASWLRSEIAVRYQDLNEDNVVCCAGAQEALTCVMQAFLTRTDHAIVVVPIYQPSERAVTSICSATCVVLEDRGTWHLDIGKIAAAVRPNTRMVLMNFPNSPTGALIDPASLAALVGLCRQHGLWLVNDEVYRLMISGPASGPPPVADVYERGISIDAVSKSLGLPGLRAGWVVCYDRALLAGVLLAKSRLSSYVATPSEVLTCIALRAEASILERNKSVARSNLWLLQKFIARHPDVFQGAASGHLAFATPRYVGAGDTEGFSIELLQATGVLLAPFALWRSGCADVPSDRLRVRLSGPGIAPALAAMDAFLTARPKRDADLRCGLSERHASALLVTR